MDDEYDSHRVINPSKIVIQIPSTIRDDTQPDPDISKTLTAAPDPECQPAAPVISPATASVIKPAMAVNPLQQFSLRGDGAKLKARAVDTKPLLGDFVMHGQATMIYAQSNSGKTLTILRLCLDAIVEGRVDPNNLYYVNADDSGSGLAEKVQLMEAAGAHTLAPRHKGFKPAQFADWLSRGAEDGSARGTVVVIDTLKKFTNLMDKGRSSEFANVCRAYVMAGGTIIALGHTAKNRNPDGTPRYQGTTDIFEDFDAVFVAELIIPKASPGQRVIRFTQQKSRADSPEVVAYAYSTQAGHSYQDKLDSLRPAYPEELEGHDVTDDHVDETEAVELLRGHFKQGHVHGQEKIVKALATMADISRATAHRILDRYTGTDPTKHYWNFKKGDRGVRIYHLLEQG